MEPGTGTPPPLSDVRVLDVSSTLPGPYCTHLLANLGADVVRVERPDGDPMRGLMPGTFDLINRGKSTVVLNLKEPADADRLHDLMAAADVLVVGFRPAVTKRLGLGADAFAARNPRGVHCAITGFGGTGSLRDQPGHDLNYLGLAGALGTPPVDDPPLLVADLSSGALAALAITAALRRREFTGEGCAIDLGMADVALTWASVRQIDALVASPGDPALRRTPGQGTFVTADGHAVTLGLIEDHFWARFAAEVRDPALRARLAGPDFASADARHDRFDEARMALAQAVAAAPLDEWLVVARRADLPIFPVHDFAAALEAPPFAERGIVDASGTPRAAFPALFDGAALLADAATAVAGRQPGRNSTWR